MNLRAIKRMVRREGTAVFQGDLMVTLVKMVASVEVEKWMDSMNIEEEESKVDVWNFA